MVLGKAALCSTAKLRADRPLGVNNGLASPAGHVRFHQVQT
jgi:hypothetical protein